MLYKMIETVYEYIFRNFIQLQKRVSGRERDAGFPRQPNQYIQGNKLFRDI